MDISVTKLPPRKKEEPIITTLLIIRVVTSSVFIMIGTLIVFSLELKDGDSSPRSRTMAFTCLVLFDLWNSLSCRSEQRSIFHMGFLSNLMYNYALTFVLFGQFLVVNLPYLQSVFQTVPLSMWDWVFLLAFTSSVFWAEEARKFYAARALAATKTPLAEMLAMAEMA